MGLFEFRDFGLSGEDDDICIDLVEGFVGLPQVRGRDWIVPRLDGEEPGNRRLGKLILPAAGFIRGTGSTPQERREDFLTNVTAAMAVLDPSLAPGTLRLSAGYLGLPVGSEATAEGRVRNASPGKLQNGQSFQLWAFDFEIYAGSWEIGS